MSMKLFIFLILSFIYFASATKQHPMNYFLKPRHKHRRLSHLHPKFRRLSVNGMLDLSSVSYEELYFLTKILVNGQLLGVHIGVLQLCGIR